MPKKNIFVASENKKAIEFLTNYFSDTQSVPSIIRSSSDVDAIFENVPNYIFFQAEWIDEQVAKKFAQLRTKHPPLKCFSLGKDVMNLVRWDGVIEFPLDDKGFRKVLLPNVDLPTTVKLLVVDDEPEISEMIQDYFSVRIQPAFEVRIAYNGLEGFKLIEQDPPHCLILDLKMPVRSGVELFQDLSRKGRKIPTIIFIDSTTADDILEIRKWGTPVFVEKGGYCSSMPDMLALVKKLVAFS